MHFHIFKATHGIDHISDAYAAQIVNTSHSVTPDDNFVSAIVIDATEMHYEEYRCEFVLKDYSVCAKTVRVQTTRELLFSHSKLDRKCNVCMK